MQTSDDWVATSAHLLFALLGELREDGDIFAHTGDIFGTPRNEKLGIGPNEHIRWKDDGAVDKGRVKARLWRGSRGAEVGLVQQGTGEGEARRRPHDRKAKQAYFNLTLHNARFERDRVNAALETENGYDKKLHRAVGGERLKGRRSNTNPHLRT